jgi:hypothetical protein
MIDRHPERDALGEFPNDDVTESIIDNSKTQRVIARSIGVGIGVHWRNIKDG